MTIERRYFAITGDAWTLTGIEAGWTLRADTTDGFFLAGNNQRVLTRSVVATADGAVLEPGGEGIYFLAAREDDTKPWCRIGALEVRPLVDMTEMNLRALIKSLRERLATQQAIVNQLGSPDGSSLTRIALPGLQRQIAKAESQLGDLIRNRMGRAPVRRV